MKIGVISAKRYRIVSRQRCGWRIHSFTISNAELSLHQIFSSAYATPARYVQEIFDRLSLLDRDASRSPTFVFNPFVHIDKPAVLRTLAVLWKEAGGGEALVLVDRTGRPVGYRLPASVTPTTSHLLTLLSTVDGQLDARCLRAAFSVDTRTVPVPNVRLDPAAANGFTTIENTLIYRWVAEEAIAAIEKAGTPSALPFAAVMPHHAGDALFLGLAHVATRSHISSVAVHRTYRRVMEEVAPDFGIIELDAPVANRSGNLQRGEVLHDYDYFEAFKGQLPRDRLYNYLRLSRDYNATTFHLLDHFAFALGRKFFRRVDLLSAQRPPTRRTRPPVDGGPIRIFLHFDAGWPLKVLPPGARRELVERLLARGHAVTAMAPPDDVVLPCHSVTFESLDQLTGLLESHHITVGMDSFPCHYSAHVLGLPTLCLFGSTRPANSDAPAAPDCVALSVGLDCVPCYGFNICPRFGGPDCRNFTAPVAVTDAVDRLIAQAYRGETAPAAGPAASPLFYEDGVADAVGHPHARVAEALWADAPQAQAFVAAAADRAAAAVGVSKRLARRVRRDGLVETGRKVLNFVARSVKERTAALRH